jgi:hypothetical protein
VPRSRASSVPSERCSGATSHRCTCNTTHAWSVCPDRLDHQPMINGVEELGDIEIDHPVLRPASATTLPDRVQCRAVRAISTRAFSRSGRTPQISFTSPPRRTPPGQYIGSPPDLSRDQKDAPVSMPLTFNNDTSSAIHFRSSPRSPPDTSCSALSFSLTTPGSQPGAAEGGLEPLPEERPRRAKPSSLAQHRLQPPALPADDLQRS